MSITPNSSQIRTKESPVHEGQPNPDPIEITSEGRYEPKSLQVDAFPNSKIRTFVCKDHFPHTIC